MPSTAVAVIDCGATNVRVSVVDDRGRVLTCHAEPNAPAVEPGTDRRIWDFEKIWKSICACGRRAVSEAQGVRIEGVTVSTFGVDGGLVDEAGALVSPVISWACDRTRRVMEKIGGYVPLERLYEITGLQPMHYNTITKLIWYRENAPELLARTRHFVFFSSLIAARMGAEIVSDLSMAGTSMMTDMRARGWSEEILGAIGVKSGLFPRMAEAGEVIGRLSDAAATETGLPSGTPIVSTGHDTQFAVFGSGAGEGEPVLSSGTWEILMVRGAPSTDPRGLGLGVSNEFDALPGLFNVGTQWIGSGVVEWVRRRFYPDCADGADFYPVMLKDIESSPPGSRGVFVHPCYFPKVGPSAPHNTHGSMLGLTLESGRGDIVRAHFEGLSFQLRQALELLEGMCSFKARSVICVGGGSKNALWNQMRADVLGVPVKCIEQKETSVLGAALFALAGIGRYASAEEARSNVEYRHTVFEPNAGARKVYEPLYQGFAELAPRLAPLYGVK